MFDESQRAIQELVHCSILPKFYQSTEFRTTAGTAVSSLCLQSQLHFSHDTHTRHTHTRHDTHTTHTTHDTTRHDTRHDATEFEEVTKALALETEKLRRMLAGLSEQRNRIALLEQKRAMLHQYYNNFEETAAELSSDVRVRWCVCGGDTMSAGSDARRRCGC